jgi:cytochrome P450
MSDNRIKEIPKVPFLLLLRRILNLKKNLLNEVESLHEQFGDVYGIQVENLKCFIRRPDLIKYVLVDNHLNYEKGVGFKLFHGLIGFGLLTSDSKKWIKERKVLNFEFTRQNQDTNFSIVEDELQKFKARWDNDNKINLTESINELTIHTITKILFNIDFDYNLNDIRKWFLDYDSYIGKQQKSFVKLPLWIPLPYLIKAKAAREGLRGFAKNIMNDCLTSPSANMIKRMKENSFDETTICDHILTFFIAGHETTANSINFTFMLLRDNPKYIEHLKQEFSPLPIDVDRQTLESQVYLDIILKESLRLFPTIPLFPRIAKTEDMLGEYKVKKGDMIAFSPWVMHRTEKYWKNALKFQPERFIDKKFEKDYIYFPFGLGPRKCIGASLSTLQMKKILFYIFKNYNFDITGPDINNFKHNVSLSPSSDVFLSKK